MVLRDVLYKALDHSHGEAMTTYFEWQEEKQCPFQRRPQTPRLRDVVVWSASENDPLEQTIDINNSEAVCRYLKRK